MVFLDKYITYISDLSYTDFLKKKQKGEESQKLELEAALKNSVEELETKKNEISLLQKQVIEFEQKLQQADEKISVKVTIQISDIFVKLIYTC